MVLFASDLDNTLIYSYKHDIGTAKRCVEIYQGREISFITEKTYALLKEIKKHVLFVPVTTRTTKQYQRIDLGVGMAEYALTCNGGVLLAGGTEDAAWYAQSLQIVSDSAKALAYGERLLKQDKHRCFEVRNIQGLFIFTKSEKPLALAAHLRESLDLEKVDVFCNGIKVYIVPKKLNKGAAVLRLKEKLKADKLVAAGDSEFDIPMLNAADLALAPKEISGKPGICGGVEFMKGKKVFSEELLIRGKNSLTFVP